MNFYTNTHPYYCGIDLHTRLLYVCIIDNENNILVHEKIDDSPDKLLALLKPYLGNIVVGWNVCTVGIGCLTFVKSTILISSLAMRFT